MKKAYCITILLLSLLLLSISLTVVSAGYSGADTLPIALNSDGKCSVTGTDTNVVVEVQGTAGATGNIRLESYSANPQVNAAIPDGIALSRFVVVTFDMNAADFSEANIYISYTDSDIVNLQEPLSIYKYVPSTNSYVLLPSTVDNNAHTITIKVTSIEDPLFAIGGSTLPPTQTPTFSGTAWAILGVSIVIIVLLVFVSVWYFKRDSK
jgi:hypothetical protein